ncbi:MAG: type II toxin-antitoxin system VapC family toxin [Actinomycetota bacterium]
MFVADTNVLVYAANADAPEHAACWPLVEGWRARTEPWHVTWGILYEFLRVTTHPDVFATPFTASQAWSFINALLAAPGLRVLGETGRHLGVLAELLDEMPQLEGNAFHHAHIAALMREHGIRRIVTRDTDFHRYSFLEVIDPLA